MLNMCKSLKLKCFIQCSIRHLYSVGLKYHMEFFLEFQKNRNSFLFYMNKVQQLVSDLVAFFFSQKSAYAIFRSCLPAQKSHKNTKLDTSPCSYFCFSYSKWLICRSLRAQKSLFFPLHRQEHGEANRELFVIKLKSSYSIHAYFNFQRLSINEWWFQFLVTMRNTHISITQVLCCFRNQLVH